MNNEKLSRERARLIMLRLSVALLGDSPFKQLATAEVEKALAAVDGGDLAFARQIRKEFKRAVQFHQLRNLFTRRDDSTNITLLLAGLVCYSAGVIGVLGPCVAAFVAIKTDPTGSLATFLRQVWLIYIFNAADSVGITPTAYLWGLMGGAGAVVSMIKRLGNIIRRKPQPLFYFAQGLFGPITGSLSAVVVCGFVAAGVSLTGLNIAKAPLVVVAFFAGFSERLLKWVGNEVTRGIPVEDNGDGT